MPMVLYTILFYITRHFIVLWYGALVLILQYSKIRSKPARTVLIYFSNIFIFSQQTTSTRYMNYDRQKNIPHFHINYPVLLYSQLLQVPARPTTVVTWWWQWCQTQYIMSYYSSSTLLDSYNTSSRYDSLYSNNTYNTSGGTTGYGVGGGLGNTASSAIDRYYSYLDDLTSGSSSSSIR